MDLKRLEAFVAVASLRNFGAAATRLGITQPAISLRLRALEEEIGERLFDRSGNAVRLTTRGLELLPFAEQVLGAVQQLRAIAVGVPAAHQRVRLGATSTIAGAWLPRLLSEIITKLNQMSVDLVVDTTPRLRQILMAGEIDVAIVMGPVHESGVRSLPLKVPKPVDREPAAEAAQGTAHHRPTRRPPDHHLCAGSGDLRGAEGAFPIKRALACPVELDNSTEALIKLVESGAAIGLISSACLDERAYPLIRTLQSELKLPSYEFFAAYHMDSVGRSGMIVAELARRACHRMPPHDHAAGVVDA